MLTRTNHRPLRGLCSVALAASSLLAFGDAVALGLGKLRVKSALDEPLVAEIELTSVQDAELETLRARLSSREDFVRANVDRPEFLGALKFDIATDAPQPFIKITTEQAAREPFLHLLVTVEWAGGELIREYTALLDPPTYALDIPASVSSPRTVAETAPEAPKPADKAPAPAVPTPVVPAAAEATTDVAPPVSGVRSGEYGPTQEGDTLWAIASKLDVGDAQTNIFQIMIALLRENPNAFVDFNINRLKVGEILKLEDIDTVAEITEDEASSVYTAHLEEWQSYKLEIAAASQVAMVPAATAEAPPQPVDTAAAEDTAAEPAEAAPQVDTQEAEAAADESPAQEEAEAAQAETAETDVLRIVRANLDEAKEAAGQAADGGTADAEAQALREQIQLLEETLTSRELENKELRERVAMLEGQVEKTNRLIELQSEQMAQMQQQAAAEPQTPAAQPAPPAPATPADKPAAAQEITKAEVKPEAKQAVQAEVKPEAAAAAAPKVAAQQPAAKPKPKKPTRVATKPKKSVPWWQDILDSLFSSWQYLVGLGVAAVALLVGLLQMIRRRRSIAEFEESILTGSVLDGQTDTTDTTRATAATDTSFLSDFGMAGMGTVQADEVDPLAESEVYLAYGRDEQAEEVLKEAIKKDSARHELKLKLLEIYQQRNDLKAFETLAEELYPAGDQGDPVIWQQVVAMGRAMNPHNPLFSQELPAAVAAAGGGGGEEQGAEQQAVPGDMSPEMVLDSSLQPFPQPEGGSNLETELDTLRGEGGAQPAPDEDISAGGEAPAAAMGEDLAAEPAQAAPAGTVEEPAADELDDVDFELDFEELEAEIQDHAEPEALEEDVAAGLDFDVPPTAPGADSDDAPEQRVAKVMPLPGNKNVASASAVEFAPEPAAPSQPAKFATSADLDEIPVAGVEAQAAAADATSGDITTNLEELAATVSNMDGVETGAADAEQWDEAATKLDLARAYIDMGDKDGARSIIDEVLKQGNPTQRTQAQELANQLSG